MRSGGSARRCCTSSPTRAASFSVPSKLSGPASKLGRHLAALSTQLNRDPTPRELADDLDISEADAAALMQMSGEDVSLSDRVGSSGGHDRREVEDVLEQVMIPAVDEELVHEAVADQLRKAVAELGRRSATSCACDSASTAATRRRCRRSATA